MISLLILFAMWVLAKFQGLDLQAAIYITGALIITEINRLHDKQRRP